MMNASAVRTAAVVKVLLIKSWVELFLWIIIPVLYTVRPLFMLSMCLGKTQLRSG